MLSKRVYKMLVFFSKQPEALFVFQTPYNKSDISELLRNGFIKEVSLDYKECEKDHSYGKEAYIISPKGKDALIMHRSEKRKNIVNWIITVITLAVSIATLLLTIKQSSQ